MGYSVKQIKDLEQTIHQTRCDVVVAATPIDLAGLIHITQPVVRVRYEYRDNSHPTLESVLLRRLGLPC